MRSDLFMKIASLLTGGLLLSKVVVLPPASAESALKDSGISYTETVETINNPGAGYTQTIWSVCKPGSTPTHNPSGNIVLFFIDIGAFSSGINDTQTDYDLDEEFFSSWRTTFENCRKNGCMIALRFRYDINGVDNPEPASFDKVLDHIAQIRGSGILEEYKDILAFVESGFVGKWGEQHGGKYTSLEYKAQLLDAMLECVPAPVPVTVRTPDIFAEWAGISRSELAEYRCEPGSDAARVGLYDDGYMGSNSDLGTYANREIETAWLGNQAVNSYFGGEFSGNIEFAKQYDTYLPENAITEMYNTHLSYINSNIFQLYKDYVFSEENDIAEVKYQQFPESANLDKSYDHSAYYGQTVFQFIRDHIGYRFVLRKSELSDAVAQGGQLELHFKVENTGFANPVPKQKAELIIEHDGAYMKTEIDVNSNNWRSCTVADETVCAKLPDSLPAGEWNAYIKLSEGDNSIDQMNLRSVRFANENTWNAALGANYLGTFTVTETQYHGTDNSFSSDAGSSDKMYSVSGQIMLDGAVSFPQEWTEDMLLAENNGNQVYMTADENYLYVKGTIPAQAESPVYNLRIENTDTGKSYWIYYASNGYVYFNNGSYDGCICKWSGDTVEFRIPFAVMDMNPGTKLKAVRVFLQDSANEWKNLGDVTASDCTVPENFNVYTAEKEIRLRGGEQYAISAETILENAQYQWYFNGTEIEGADSAEYTITANTGSAGKYSVEIRAQSGIAKTVAVCDLLEVLDTAKGDVNLDGECSIADAVMLQKWLLRAGELTCWQNADLCEDGIIDAFDLCLLRRMLTSDQ